MFSSVAVVLAVLIACAVIVMGSCYLISPPMVTGSFGLKLPAPDADTRAWLRLKGIRDVGAGLVVLTLLALAGRHVAGLALLAFAVIPLGDMLIVLGSDGSRSKAFWIHGLTCAVMLVAGVWMVRG